MSVFEGVTFLFRINHLCTAQEHALSFTVVDFLSARLFTHSIYQVNIILVFFSILGKWSRFPLPCTATYVHTHIIDVCVAYIYNKRQIEKNSSTASCKNKSTRGGRKSELIKSSKNWCAVPLWYFFCWCFEEEKKMILFPSLQCNKAIRHHRHQQQQALIICCVYIYIRGKWHETNARDALPDGKQTDKIIKMQGVQSHSQHDGTFLCVTVYDWKWGPSYSSTSIPSPNFHPQFKYFFGICLISIFEDLIFYIIHIS